MALNTVQAILQAYANRVQDVEDVGFAVLTALSDPTFAACTGDLLKKIGAIVGESQNGRSDADYRAAIRLRIRANRSRGKAEDIIAIALLAAINSTPSYYEPNDDSPVFHLDITNLPSPAEVIKILGDAKPLGVPGRLNYTPDALTYATWGDSAQPSPLTASNTWGDSVGATGPLWPVGMALTSS